VFDRRVPAHPDCMPDDTHLFLGNFRETIPDAMARIGEPVALLHGNIGTGNSAKNDELAAWLGPANFSTSEI